MVGISFNAAFMLFTPARKRRYNASVVATQMGEFLDLNSESFDRELERVRKVLGDKKSPSIRELIEKTQDQDFRKKLTGLVAPLKASHASGRYPTVAQVRKMLAANDNTTPDTVDYSAKVAEYKALFSKCLAETGEVNSLIKKLSKEFRVNGIALAAIANAITDGSRSKLSLADAKAAIMDEFANRSVALMAKRAAGNAKPF